MSNKIRLASRPTRQAEARHALSQAVEHWPSIVPLLEVIENEAAYDARVAALDELLDIVGEDETHPLASLASRIGDTIRHYDETHRPDGAQP